MPRLADRRKRQEEAVAGLWEVIAERGMEAASVRSVIAQTSRSRGLIDYHFRNFEELILIGLRRLCVFITQPLSYKLVETQALLGLRGAPLVVSLERFRRL